MRRSSISRSMRFASLRSRRRRSPACWKRWALSRLHRPALDELVRAQGLDEDVLSALSALGRIARAAASDTHVSKKHGPDEGAAH